MQGFFAVKNLSVVYPGAQCDHMLCDNVRGTPHAKGMEVCSWQAFLKDKKSCLLDSNTFRDSYWNSLHIYFAVFFDRGSPAPRKFEAWMNKLGIDYMLLSTYLSEKDGLWRELVIKLLSEIAEISHQRFKFGWMVNSHHRTGCNYFYSIQYLLLVESVLVNLQKSRGNTASHDCSFVLELP